MFSLAASPVTWSANLSSISFYSWLTSFSVFCFVSNRVRARFFFFQDLGFPPIRRLSRWRLIKEQFLLRTCQSSYLWTQRIIVWIHLSTSNISVWRNSVLSIGFTLSIHFNVSALLQNHILKPFNTFRFYFPQFSRLSHKEQYSSCSILSASSTTLRLNCMPKEISSCLKRS